MSRQPPLFDNTSPGTAKTEYKVSGFSLGPATLAYNLSPNMTYSVIKGGIISLSKQMASNYGKYKIRVNSVSPGGVIDKKLSSKSKSSKLFRSNYINRVPLARFAKPEEIAAPIIFLASDSASYITGINLLVDGGWTSI